ncbi:hypothetical protein C7999DRAFT_32662 [Corynascus novoguineensis]|uniref:2EXR domain-containing protein n=1 Tax=Corynascus novoguineensis TaxID=1126955 RepID=A0AAN7HIJ6_9PEZI|nr:hypothetical protein C7999DRAFT_32662 [Corynascus novoguineensis]
MGLKRDVGAGNNYVVQVTGWDCKTRRPTRGSAQNCGLNAGVTSKRDDLGGESLSQDNFFTDMTASGENALMMSIGDVNSGSYTFNLSIAAGTITAVHAVDSDGNTLDASMNGGTSTTTLQASFDPYVVTVRVSEPAFDVALWALTRESQVELAYNLSHSAVDTPSTPPSSSTAGRKGLVKTKEAGGARGLVLLDFGVLTGVIGGLLFLPPLCLDSPIFLSLSSNNNNNNNNDDDDDDDDDNDNDNDRIEQPALLMTIMATAATATFHPFSRLPFELCARIWELTVELRIVEVRVIYYDPSPVKVTDRNAWTPEWSKKRLPPMRHLRSFTPAPAQLQTCRESREDRRKQPCSGYQKAFSEIMTMPYDGFDPVPEKYPQDQRDRYVWLSFDVDIVSIGETDLHGIRSGFSVAEDIYFPCGPENVYFADPEEWGGKIMSSVDLDAMAIREYEERNGREEKLKKDLTH